jgi:putative ABC transport system permease protein
VAELEHRCSDGPREGLVRFSLGSIAHAFYLRREEKTMSGWIADVRHSVRALARRPGFAVLTIATLAVGIGSATAIFSLAEALVLRPLPLAESDRLVRVFSTNPTLGTGRFSVSHPDYDDFTSRGDLFESASFYVERDRDVSDGGDPERVRTVAVHEDYFQTLRSPVALGRVFGTGDHDPASEATAVLAEAFWAGRFGADPTVVGRTIRLDGVPHTVVGVIADSHGWPSGTQVWTPLQWGGVVPASAGVRANHTWQVLGRLREGVEVADASDQIGAMARTIYAGPDVAERDRATSAVVVPLRASDAGEGAGALFALLGTAVFLVLLIACMNASALLLTRAWARAGELSLRSALGAGRLRLAAILLAESVVLALVGGAIGIGLGHVGLRRAFAMAPPDITRLGEIRLSVPVVAVGVGISVAAALVAGLVPALRASRVTLAESLRDGAGQAGQGRSVTNLRRGLIVAELALSLALLVGAGLTIRGFQRQIASDPGFEATNLLSFTVRLPAARYGDDALVDAYFEQAIERLEGLPGVAAATSTSRLPLGAGGLSLSRSLIFDGAPAPPEGVAYGAAWVEVDPEYFETLGVGASAGRGFTNDDRSDAPPVAVVSESLARQMSPDAPIVGRSVRSHYDEDLPRTIVGVIPDLQYNGVSRARPRPIVLVPRAQSVRASMAFLVRTSSDPSDAIPAVRQAMTELDPDVALDALQPLRDAHASDLSGIRFLTTLFATFGVLALVLATSGVYGLISFSVAQRTREIGVRMAVGATRGSVRAAVLRESLALGVVGLTTGAGLAYAGGRALAAGMDGIAVLEASTFGGVALVLSGVVMAASWIPASRATRVDPVEALRSD